MTYTLKTVVELQTLRSRFLTALTSDRLNATNRVSIEGWISEIETALIAKATPAKVAKPVTTPAPSIRAMRNGTETPQTAGDRERLAMSFMS